MTGDTVQTSAQRWNQLARDTIEHAGRTEFAALLAEEFVHESRRVDHFGLSRTALLDMYDVMKTMDFHISGTDVAVAGDLHVLTRRGYHTPQTDTHLLAISEWTPGGRLARLIEFDPDDLDAALGELAAATGQDVVVLTPDDPADG